MLARIVRAWKLSKKEPEALEQAMSVSDTIPEIGDGGGAFLGEGTHEEFLQQQREDEGMAPWYKRLERLI